MNIKCLLLSRLTVLSDVGRLVMRIEFKGSGFELLVGKIGEVVGKELAEIGDELTSEKLIDIAGEWTEINDYVHYHGPDEDEIILEIDGTEIDPNIGEPNDFDLPEMINSFGIKDDGARFICVTIVRESGYFGCIDLPDDADLEKFQIVSQAPEYAGEEFCVFSHYFYDREQVFLNDDAVDTKTSLVKHIIFDVREEEVVAES